MPPQRTASGPYCEAKYGSAAGAGIGRTDEFNTELLVEGPSGQCAADQRVAVRPTEVPAYIGRGDINSCAVLRTRGHYVAAKEVAADFIRQAHVHLHN